MRLMIIEEYGNKKTWNSNIGLDKDYDTLKKIENNSRGPFLENMRWIYRFTSL